MENVPIVNILEFVLVSVILGLQLIVFIRTWVKVNRYRNIFSGSTTFYQKEMLFSPGVLRNEKPETLINLINNIYKTSRDLDAEWPNYAIVEPGSQHTNNNQVEGDDGDASTPPSLSLKGPEGQLAVTAYFDYEEVEKLRNAHVYVATPVILTSERDNPVLNEILFSLNSYLVRNKGSVADFLLIKDVVERNVDAEEIEIRASLPIPLYLGLMGTMAGIIIGLVFMPDIAADLFGEGVNPEASRLFAQGIRVLLGGVKIAMIASLVGLTLTTVGSGLLFRNALGVVEQRKNKFLTFLQVELLPILSQDVTASLHDLRLNFSSFNQEFRENLAGLGIHSNTVMDSMKLQKEVLVRLENADFTQLIKANITTFEQIQHTIEALSDSAHKIERFNDYIHLLNGFIEKSQALSNRLQDVLNRSGDLKVIGNEIRENIRENGELQYFLRTHFSELQDRGIVINKAVSSVDSTLKDSLTKLGETANERMNALRKAQVDYEADMGETLKSLKESNQKALGEITTAMASSLSEFKTRLSETLVENVDVLNNLRSLGDLHEQLGNYIQSDEKTKSQISSSLMAFSEEASGLRKLMDLQSARAARSPLMAKVTRWLVLICLGLASILLAGGLGYGVFYLFFS